jgi:DNA-binding MarR family transcriptional regulator
MELDQTRLSGAAFLLAQLGDHAADRFAERIRVLRILPAHAGILRLIANASFNQQALAKHLGILPSRMVILIDELAERKLLRRKRSQKDRRNYDLLLTSTGHQILKKLSKIATEHEADLCAALTLEERHTLAALCRKIVSQQELTTDVHPGYRKL